MIRYALRCEDGHAFESWFASAGTFDRLSAAGQLSCAVCGGAGVTKALMAPAVTAEKADAAAPMPADAPAQADASASSGAGVPALSAPSHPLEAALKALRKRVEAEAENVGRDFARTARAIHAGEAPARPVWGEATPAEARALIEDDIPALPLPFPSRRDS